LRPVIHSQKHYVQQSLATVATVSRIAIDIIVAVEGTVANLVNEVIEGAVVKAVFFELWLLDSGNDGSNTVTVTKQPMTVAGPTFAEMAALGTYVNKKNVLFTHQGLSSNDGIGNPVQVLGGWIKIPKSKQRFGLGDKLTLCISNNGANNLNFCGFTTYKEYT